MDSTSREDLSALMDGELASEPTRFLLRRLEHDPELGATWSRWHLIRACLASDPTRMTAPRADGDFTARVAAALAVETRASQVTHRRHWVRYVGGGAIAAGVAVAALMLNVPGLQDTVPAPVARTTAPDSALAVPVADTQPAGNPMTPPWLMSRQPTVLGAQPASANVVYGTGLLQPDYLRRATYARDAAYMPYAQPSQLNGSALPFSIVVLPEAPPSSGASSLAH